MQLDTRAAYEIWARRYPPIAHNPLMIVEEQAVISLLPPLQSRVALDAGCGTGRYMRILAARGARRVIGVDCSAAMLERSRPAAAIRGDMAALPIASGSVNVIVSGLAMNDIAGVDVVMRELARVLAPGGVLVFSALHPRGADSHWLRTFHAAGRTWSLPAEWHSVEAYQRACTDAGLAIDECREPALPGRGSVAIVFRARR